MTGLLQLTEVKNPIAQTFRVTEPGGSVLTSVGVFFATAPKSTDAQIPITIELRPVVEGGNPSSTRFIPGTRVTATAAAIRAKASTTFSSATEYKFTFREPVHVPANVEIAFVLSTSAPVGQYQVWFGKQGEYVQGSNNSRLIASNLNAGALFLSSNGTTWSPDQYSDLAFKIYRAKFRQERSIAYLSADAPPVKKLTENTFTQAIHKYRSDPLSFTAGNKKIRVIHPAHGFQIGDKVKISADSDGLDSADTVNGISAAQILKTHTIDSADMYGYTIRSTTNATASVRAGGNSLRASEQYVMDEMGLSVPITTPNDTSIKATGTFTTHKSFGGSEVAYTTTQEKRVPVNKMIHNRDPFLLAAQEQEDDAAKLNGNPSTIIKMKMETANQYAAPYFNIAAARLKANSFFIDAQQSDDSDISGRNYITTISHVAENNYDGGTSTFRHLTKPFTLETAATSIRVIMDAVRPKGSYFSVWYRTARQTDEDNIRFTDWKEFSKTINPPNSSNYSQLGDGEEYRQYEFNVYDIDEFDIYQIKLTFGSNKSTAVPMARNLRTIATI